jgi:serine/threonine protein kinase
MKDSIGKTLGKGTFGKVKLGTHQITKEKAAIKILDKSMIKDASDLERVNREISILKKLRHPHVVQLFDVNPIRLF